MFRRFNFTILILFLLGSSTLVNAQQFNLSQQNNLSRCTNIAISEAFSELDYFFSHSKHPNLIVRFFSQYALVEALKDLNPSQSMSPSLSVIGSTIGHRLKQIEPYVNGVSNTKLALRWALYQHPISQWIAEAGKSFGAVVMTGGIVNQYLLYEDMEIGHMQEDLGYRIIEVITKEQYADTHELLRRGSLKVPGDLLYKSQIVIQEFLSLVTENIDKSTSTEDISVFCKKIGKETLALNIIFELAELGNIQFIKNQSLL